MNRKERYSEENIKNAVENSSCIKEAIKFIGLRAAGGNYKIFHKYVEKYNIDISHFSENVKNNIGNWASKNKINLCDILTENSDYNRTHLKDRLYEEGLKERKCEMPGCGQGEIWLGKKISLILDHINGVYNDNRLENLRIICPNCNASLPTHAGKNSKKEKKKYNCIDCDTQISKSAKRCKVCSNKYKGYKSPNK